MDFDPGRLAQAKRGEVTRVGIVFERPSGNWSTRPFPAIRGRMHGGKSPGRPVMYGRYTRAAIERWIEVERHGDHVLMEQSV